ncbi:F-box/WD repeat-containing protein 4-like [Babylonia areolata]|uniref:F-box/WD repeat-containing protein 4-like n=1 Tax=Babylonia areolata TaxID=304850 RepID=UPI003FD43941
MERASQSKTSKSGSRRRGGKSAQSNRTRNNPVFTDSESPSCGVLELPDDVWFVIFRYLSPGTLCKLCRVSKRFRQLASADCVWLPYEKDRIFIRPADSRPSRDLGSIKERYRVSLNWENGHRREYWMLRYNHRMLPWLQKNEDSLLVSRGNVIHQFTIQNNGRLRDRPRADLRGMPTDVTRFVIHNDIVVSGSRGGDVSTWEASSGVHLMLYKNVHDSDTQCLDVVDNVIVSGSKDKTVRVLSLCPEDDEKIKKIFNIGDRMWSLSASPNGCTVAAGTAGYNNPAIALLDISSGEFLGHLGHEHKRGFGVLDMKFESANILLTCGHDSYVRMWDLRTHECVNQWEDKFDSTVYCLQSDDQNTMLTGTARHGLVRLWDKRQQHDVQAYYSGDQNSPVYSLVANSRYMYLAMDMGLDLVDFSVR